METIDRFGGLLGLTAAPLLPSLQHEADLGFDVAIATHWQLLFLQFKIASRLVRKSAAEAHVFPVPYFRFAVKTDVTSNGMCQHNTLCELESALPGGADFVLYVAPLFDSVTDFNAYARAGALTSHSVFVAPSVLGPVSPGEGHCFAYRTAFDIRAFSEAGPPTDGSFERLLRVLAMQSRPPRPLSEFLRTCDDVFNRVLGGQVLDDQPGLATSLGALSLGLQPILLRIDAEALSDQPAG
jgi:hypothetical protein